MALHVPVAEGVREPEARNPSQPLATSQDWFLFTCGRQEGGDYSVRAATTTDRGTREHRARHAYPARCCDTDVSEASRAQDLSREG